MSRESSLPLPLLNRGREEPTLNGAILASIFEVSLFSCRLSIVLHLFNYINEQKRKVESLANMLKQARLTRPLVSFAGHMALLRACIGNCRGPGHISG